MTEIETGHNADRQGGLVAQGALAYARASDTALPCNLCNFPNISNVNSRKFVCTLFTRQGSQLSKSKRTGVPQNASTPIRRRTFAFYPDRSLRCIRAAAATTR